MFNFRQQREQEVRERQLRQEQDARRQAMEAQRRQLRQQLSLQASTVHDFLGDPRHEGYRRLLEEARAAFRFQLRQLMSKTMEAPDPARMSWLMSRIELLTDILEAPQRIADALADQRSEKAGGNGAVA